MYCKFSARVQNVIIIFAVQIKLINIVSEKSVLIFACHPSSHTLLCWSSLYSSVFSATKNKRFESSQERNYPVPLAVHPHLSSKDRNL